MKEKDSNLKDFYHLALATVDTATLVGTIKLATLGPEGVSNLVNKVATDLIIQNPNLIRAAEIALSPRGALGFITALSVISLVETLRGLNFYRGIYELLQSKKDADPLTNFMVSSPTVKSLFGLFDDPSEKGSKRLNKKGILVGVATGTAFGNVYGAFSAVISGLATGDLESAKSTYAFVAPATGTFFSYYMARQFGYLIS